MDFCAPKGGKMEQFTGRVVLISGATRGIGKAIAQSFLQEGATVIGLYAGNEAAADHFRQQTVAIANRVDLRRCDVSNHQEVCDLFSSIENTYQKIDVLINNAGIRRDAILAMMSVSQWQEVIDTNLTGTYLLSKLAIPLMLSNKFGRIINITSPVAHLGFAGQSNYAASKAGQVAFTKSLAKEVARKKITVNCVSPGFIATEFLDGLPPELLAEYKKMVPMRRFGSPEDVAHAVLFLAGEKAAYITGTVLEISGGL